MKNLATLYQSKIESGQIVQDPLQARMVDVLFSVLKELGKASVTYSRKSVFSILRKRKIVLPKGVYVHGPVGRGKTFIMDMFYDCVDESVGKKRVHFHEFMLELHDYIHKMRGSIELDEAIPSFAKELSSNVTLLCFDEFHVTDIADAMILGRLFNALWNQGVVTIITSNWEPDSLYENGIQRDRFIPFIETLKEKLTIVNLNGETDYRMAKILDMNVYFYPGGKGADRRMDQAFLDLTEGKQIESQVFKVKGHDVYVPKVGGGVARFDYDDLVGKSYGAQDFLEIADRFHTVFIDYVPKLTPDQRDEAKRFMVLIDALYDKKVKVFISARTAPNKIYEEGRLAFEFDRTVSRLMEMQSKEYLAQDVT